ncbi:hypothetical protein GCM10027067_07270 [Pseudactinotalea suaedae]
MTCRSVGAVTTTKTTNRFLYLAAATALGLTLASCSGDGGGEETSGAEGGGDATSEQTEETTTEGDEETEDAGGGDAAAGPECLVGTWEMTPEAMEEQVLAQLGGEGEVTVEGTSTMTFDGSTMTTDAQNSSSYSAEVEGTAVEGATTTDATVVVSYTADDTTLSYDEVVSAEGAISVTVAGTTEEQDIADTASAMAGQTQNYTCTDAELTLSIEMQGMEFSQTFTRA